MRKCTNGGVGFRVHAYARRPQADLSQHDLSIRTYNFSPSASTRQVRGTSGTMYEGAVVNLKALRFLTSIIQNSE